MTLTRIEGKRRPSVTRLPRHGKQKHFRAAATSGRSFLADNKDKNNLATSIHVCKDADGFTKLVNTGDEVCYFRPGEQGKKWWYNGKVADLQMVQFPSGQRAVVMGVN